MRTLPPLLAVIAVAFSAAGCATRPSTLEDERPLVMIKSVRLPERAWVPWYSRFAEHLWIDLYHGDGWVRVEWDNIDYVRVVDIGPGHAFGDERWGRSVAVHETFSGERGQQLAAAIVATAAEYPCAQHYRAWPGPNSNSFLVWLADRVDMPFVPPPTAVGKDFTTWLRVGLTPGGTGLELETLPLGVELGLREGVELHVLGLTLGVGFWPPAIELPFLPAIPGGWFAP